MTGNCLEKSSSSPVCFSVSHDPMKTNEVTRQEVEIYLLKKVEKGREVLKKNINIFKKNNFMELNFYINIERIKNELHELHDCE